jgi:hypothetical protein
VYAYRLFALDGVDGNDEEQKGIFNGCHFDTNLPDKPPMPVPGDSKQPQDLH